MYLGSGRVSNGRAEVFGVWYAISNVIWNVIPKDMLISCASLSSRTYRTQLAGEEPRFMGTRERRRGSWVAWSQLLVTGRSWQLFSEVLNRFSIVPGSWSLTNGSSQRLIARGSKWNTSEEFYYYQETGSKENHRTLDFQSYRCNWMDDTAGNYQKTLLHLSWSKAEGKKSGFPSELQLGSRSGQRRGSLSGRTLV